MKNSLSKNSKGRGLVAQMEKEIGDLVKKEFGDDLISLVVEGSYGIYDTIEGYSDYDLLILVRDASINVQIDFDSIAKKYSLEIGYVIKSYGDFENRLINNEKSTRFIGNLELVALKKKARILAGEDVLVLIPEVGELIQRDILSEWKANYLHAVSPEWNIFEREPRKWVNYIINMSDSLLLGQGIGITKEKLPQALEKYHPQFLGLDYLNKALKLRQTKKVLTLNEEEREILKKELKLFLEEYQRYIFHFKK